MSLPPQFMCPITLQLMKDPVVASDSQTCMPHTMRFAHSHVASMCLAASRNTDVAS